MENDPLRPRRFERGGALLAVLGFALLALAFVVIAFTESDNQVRQVALEMRQQQSLAACELGFSAAIARLNLGQSPDFDSELRDLQDVSTTATLGTPPTSPSQPPSQDFSDPNGKDDDADGYADFEEAPSFGEQRALFANRVSGSFAVRGIKIDDDTFKIRVFGVHDGDVRVLEGIIQRQGQALVVGGSGFFGSEKLEIEKNSFIDSYISGGTSPSVIATGAPPQVYNATTKEVVIDGVATGFFETYDRSNVQVGSNEQLDIKKDSKIIATTIIGPDGSIANEGTSYVPPVVLPENLEADPTAFTTPTLNDNSLILSTLIVDNGFFVPANSNYTLGADGESHVYVFNKFKTKKNASGLIKGDVTIYLTQEMKFEEGTLLTVDPGATLKVLTLDKITIEKNLRVNEGGYPGAVQLRIKPTVLSEVKLSEGGIFYGAIDAPGSKIEIEKNMNFYGGLRGQEVKLKEGGSFHYDESLAGFANNATSDDSFVLIGQQEIR